MGGKPQRVLRTTIRNFPLLGEDALAVISELTEEADDTLRSLAVDNVLRMLDHGWLFERRELDVLPAWLIDGIVAAPVLPRRDQVSLLAAMVTGATPDARVAQWQTARAITRRLRARPHNAVSLRKDVQIVGENRDWVDAVITAVEVCDELSYPFAAVLVADGSVRAIAALRRHLAADAWPLEKALGKIPATSPVYTLVGELQRERERAFADSPGGVLLQSLNLSSNRIHLVADFVCEARDASLGVHIAANRLHPIGVFQVHCREGAAKTSFDTNTLFEDELGLGRCNILELPEWVAHAPQPYLDPKEAAQGEPSRASSADGQALVGSGFAGGVTPWLAG